MRTIVLTVLLLGLMACSDQKTSADYLARAKEYIAAHDNPAAIIELKNALTLDGDSAEARWLLGKSFLDDGDFLAAENELRRAQDLGWTADDIRPALAKALLALGKFADALKLDYEELGSVAAAKVLSSQAIAAVSDKHPDKARQLIASAQEKEPRLLEVNLSRATIALYQSEPKDVLNIVEPILATTPDSGEAWWLKGQALLRQGKLEEARAALDQSITHSNTALADRTTRALINLELKDNEAAQADAAELLKASPKDPVANYIQGVIHFRNKRYRDAVTVLAQAEPVARQFPLSLFYLGLGYLIEKDLDLAEKFGAQYVASQPDAASGRKLLASILVLQNKPKDAVDVLQPVLDQNSDDVQALNILANALLLDDQADIAMVLYGRIAQLQPDWRFIPLRLEASLVTPEGEAVTGQQADAASDNSNFPQSDILLILSHLAKKDFPGAIDAAKAYQFRDLKSLSPYQVLGRVYLAAGQPEDAREVYEKALQRDPGNPAANLSLAQLAIQSGQADKARKYYETILDAHLDDLSTLLQLSALEASDKNEDAMVARLNQAMRAHPAALEPRLRLARYYIQSGNPDKVAALFANLGGLQQRSPQVLELTALAQLAMKQSNVAVATLQQLVDVKPDAAQFRYLLAMAASESGDEPRAKRELKAAVDKDPKHLPSLLNLARIARSEGQQQQFDQYLATLVELAPDSPHVLRLRADAVQASGNVGEALAMSQRAFKQSPTTQTVVQLTTLQKQAGENEAARNTLQVWVAAHPKDVTVRLVLAHDLELANENAGAKAQYAAVLEVEPENITALNNLAWHLRLEDPKKALLYIRKATGLASDQPPLLDTLAVIESLNGDHQSALATIRRALAAMPDDATMRYHEAMIVAALGDKAQAIATLEGLVTKAPEEFPERAEAQALLKTLKG